jgi:hypothetical protein
LRPKAKTASPFVGWRLAMKGHGLGLGFVIGLVAQGHAVIIIIINLVIVASKKKFAKRLPFGFTPTTLKVLQPSLFSEPL